MASKKVKSKVETVVPATVSEEITSIAPDKKSGKGIKTFTLSGDTEKVRRFFSRIYQMLDKSKLEYRGKKSELVAKKGDFLRDDTGKLVDFVVVIT